MGQKENFPVVGKAGCEVDGAGDRLVCLAAPGGRLDDDGRQLGP
jgi:hypothetical protein